MKVHVGRGALLLLVFFLAACSHQVSEPQFQHVGWTMGTSFSVKVSTLPPTVDADKLKAGLEQRLDQINQQMSTYLEDSELSRFNHSNTTEWVDASADLVKVLEESLRVSAMSGGAFDVTVGPLVNLWGFGPDETGDKVPSPQQIEALRKNIGYQQLRIRRSPPAIRKENPSLYVDLSAVAKGFAVDQLAEFLESFAIADYLVEIGGEVRVKGQSPRGGEWKIAIEKPTPAARKVQRILELRDRAVATSGDYRNYFEKNGKRYSHTIDPRTGSPIIHRLASVTVLSDTAMYADALATALTVLGPEAGLEWAEKENLAALFIVKEDEGFVEINTDAFSQYIQ